MTFWECCEDGGLKLSLLVNQSEFHLSTSMQVTVIIDYFSIEGTTGGNDGRQRLEALLNAPWNPRLL